MPDDDNGKSTPGSGNQLIAEIIADARAAYMQKVTRDYDIIIAPYVDMIHALTQRLGEAESQLKKA